MLLFNDYKSSHSSNILIHLFLLEMSRDLIAPTCFLVCFSKAFLNREYANLACSIICL